MSLSKRIRDLRYAKGWGPDDLAEQAGLSRTALYNIERERTRHPHAATLRQIAEALEVPVEALYDGEVAQTARRAEALTPAAAKPGSPAPLSAERRWEIEGKFLEILDSPLADGIAILIEESYQILRRRAGQATTTFADGSGAPARPANP